MRRFFTEPQNIHGDMATIVEDAGHITRVLRMQPGDEILLFDGTGYEYTAVLDEIDSKACVVRILAREFSKQEPKVQVSVFQGIPKSGKMESIIQKSVELGVCEIIPTAMERCVARLDGGKKEQEKLKRWNKVSMEAAKQCGRGLVPVVMPSVSFTEALKRMQEFDLALMPYELLGHQGEASLKKVLQAHSEGKRIGILIGPEGGLSDAEATMATEHGLQLVGLGRRILRTETVASAMLSMILYEMNEF